MKLIVGLGNPGRKYVQNRHNVGFRVVEELARRWGIELTHRRFESLTGGGRVGGQQVVLLKPMTYMNLSGRSVREAAVFYKLPAQDLLVILDDMALPVGRLRIRPQGSAGGHNGLSSVIAELGTEEFARVRLGIGAVAGRFAVDHVLGDFSPEEEEIIAPAVQRAAEVAETWLHEGPDAAMNRYNRPEDDNNNER